MRVFHEIGIAAGEILLPAANVSKEKWAVVACDQYTSQPGYWTDVENIVGEEPSTVKITFPEVYLEQDGKEKRIQQIQQNMKQYLADGILTPAVSEGFVLVERTTEAGKRVGLVMMVDLDCYDYSVGSTSMIRATEGTIIERIPPRVAIREDATLELPHIMILIDDKNRTVIEPVYEKRAQLSVLYDFDLMQGGGHLSGWAVEGSAVTGVTDALTSLKATCGGLLYAMGDGNHSLATAKACWMKKKETLTEEEQQNHPARYALVELVNLYSDALVFEAIHRELFDVNGGELLDGFLAWAKKNGTEVVPVAMDEKWDMVSILNGNKTAYQVKNLGTSIPVAVLQTYLDQYLAEHEQARIDYIHGSDVVEELSREPHTIGFLLAAMDKETLFPFVREQGSLPRKTFSMGEAHEKRYYMEARRIQK
ncbi:MAG: DUF1015 domain-containing protein [Lachnospiraceae bacterium]